MRPIEVDVDRLVPTLSASSRGRPVQYDEDRKRQLLATRMRIERRRLCEASRWLADELDDNRQRVSVIE